MHPTESKPSSIESFFLDGPAGRLEAQLNHGKADASHAALVCHPHPLFGGTLHTKAVFHTMKALNNFGFPVLRFNFRGAGLSHGTHDHGEGEAVDVRATLDWLDARFHLPMICAGFSFGAAMGLRAACPDARVKAVIGVGTPVSPVDRRIYDLQFLKTCAKPKLFVSGEFDQYGPRADMEKLMATTADPKVLVFIKGADHFFEGRLPELRGAIEGWLKGLLQSNHDRQL